MWLRLVLLGLSRNRARPIYRFFVFDLDGTLVDSSEDLASAANAALAAQGLRRLPLDRVLAHVGNGAAALVAGCVREADAHAPEAVRGRVYEHFLEHYRRHALDRTRLYPGIPEALEGLTRSGCRLVVLTNKPRSFSEDILRGLGVRSFFAEVVGGDDEPTRKPDPAGLAGLVERSGFPREGAVLVGDSRVDLATAAAAGIASCAVTWGFVPEEELREAGATHWARRPADLLGLAR